jgi:hypothetical protein
MTTVGAAIVVFSNNRTTDFPLKFLSANRVPTGSPTEAEKIVDQKDTVIESHTI